MPDQFPSVGPVGDTQPTVWDDRPMFALAADVTVYDKLFSELADLAAYDYAARRELDRIAEEYRHLS